ncbi:hypothetical protein D3C83_180500 [compost metagenome]
MKVFDVLGKEVATIFDGEGKAGRIFQAKFNAGEVSAGVYFARLNYGRTQILRKMMLLK